MDARHDRQNERVTIGPGRFVMGCDAPFANRADGEHRLHRVKIRAFALDRFAVTNTRFAAFVAATGHVTDAERFGWSFVFHGLLGGEGTEAQRAAEVPWWVRIEGASWRHPEGPGSDTRGRDHHPVTHVSHADALAFCAWEGSRLPSEAEWEFAARGGLEGAVFPWGNELEPGGAHRMNVWQGLFPHANTMADGYYGTAPVDAYTPNGYGLHNMCGNVWEWCADWFDSGYYRRSPQSNPTGPREGTARVMRGGSFLCHASYCNRYRVAARSSNTPDSSASNLGFRTAAAPD